MPIVSSNEKGTNYWFAVLGSDGADSLGQSLMLHNILTRSPVSNYG